jgi:uncharacterized protein
VRIVLDTNVVVSAVLWRGSPHQLLAAIGRTASSLVADYVQALELVEPVSVPSVVPGDADDDHVIAAAVAADADLIVSGDSHLLALKTFGRIEIVTPAEAIRRITVL